MEQEKMAVQPPVREGSHGMPDWHVISGSTLKMIAVITLGESGLEQYGCL